MQTIEYSKGSTYNTRCSSNFSGSESGTEGAEVATLQFDRTGSDHK